MAVIGSLSVKLGLVTVDWDKATAKAKQQAKDLQGSFNNLGIDLKNLKNTFNALGGAMGLSLAGMGILAKATMDMAGQVDDLAKSYDMSIARVLQFQKAIVMSGGKAEDANKILSTMFSKIASAQEGNDAAIATFEQLGISFRELQSLSPDQVIRRVYEGLAQIGNTYERVKLTKEILGKGGMGKSVEEIAEALGKSSAEFRKQEESMKRLAELGDALDATYNNLKLAIADVLSPFTGSSGGEALVNVNTFKAAMVAVTSAAVINGMFRLVAVFKALNAALKTTASLGIAIQSAQGVKGIAMAGAALASYFAAKKIFDDQTEEAIAAAESEPPSSTPSPSAGGGGAKGSNEAAALRAKVDLSMKLFDIERRRGEYRLAGLYESQHENRLAEVALKFEEEQAKASAERAEALSKSNLSSAMRAAIQEKYQVAIAVATLKERQDREYINAERTKELKMQELMGEHMVKMEIFNERRNQLEGQRYKMNQFDYRIAEERLALEKKIAELEQKKKEAFEKIGGANSTNRLQPEYVNEKNMIEQTIEAEKKLAEIRIGNIESERARQQSFSEGWNQAFRQFSEDAENYARVGGESFNAVVSNMNSAIDSFVRTGKFSFKDFAKSIIQDLIAIQLKMQAMQLFKMGMNFFFPGAGSVPGKAGGGFTNVPTMVGENGPELFIPNRQGGTVIPNQQLSSVMGSQPQVVYNAPVVQHLSAIDTQSAVQFLTQNKSTIYAANQSAARSMPTSR
jgi:lambda family phage tail tape measure protein